MQPIEVLLNKESVWRSMVSMASVLTFIFALSNAPVVAGQTKDTDGLQILAQQKKEMEQQAYILLGLRESDDITQEEYEEGQRLYGKAQTAMDKWIAQLQQALQEGKNPESSEAYQAALQEAANTSEVFREDVHEKFLGNPRGKAAQQTRKVLNAIQEAALLIWTAATDDGGAAKEQKIAQDLEGKKLASFAQIEAKK